MDNEKDTLELDTDKSRHASIIKHYFWKNIIILAICFLLYQSSLIGLFPLQSSLHSDSGLGTLSVSIREACYGIGCLFLPNILIKALGLKWTMSISMMSLPLWIVANGVGVWEAMVPASVLNGLFTGPLWAGMGAYINKLSQIYTKDNNNESFEKTVTICFTITNTGLAVSGILGKVISNTILKQDPPENVTKPDPDDIREYCGIEGCPWIDIPSDNATYSNEPSERTVWILVAMYFVISVLSICGMIFTLDTTSTVNNIANNNSIYKQRYDCNCTGFCKTNKKELCLESLSVLLLLKGYRIWLLAPINIGATMLGSFMGADFSYSWVTCALGIWMIGLVTLPESVLAIFIIPLTGYLAKVKRNKIPLMALAYLLFLTISLILFFWHINSDDVWVYYTISTLKGWYYASTVMIIESTIAVGFQNDAVAAYACYNMFYSLGSAVSYGYSYYLCNNVKLCMVLTVITFGFTCYFILEYILYKDESTKNSTINNECNFSKVTANLASETDIDCKNIVSDECTRM